MGKKRKKQKKESRLERIRNIANKYMKVVICAYLLLMICIFPFYAPQGYVEIGINKYKFFRVTGILCAALICPAVITLCVYYIKAKEKIKLSLTDKVVLFYGLAVVLSFICSDWKEDAFWGTDGWYMGLVSQLMFVIIYFTVSRFSENIKKWYWVFLAVSSIVFLLGLCNRFSIYPIEMEGSNPGFISTLGNINWFCSYWIIAFPIGIVLYWIGEGDVRWKKITLISYLILGYMTGTVQGSNSGFLALGAVLLVLFFLSFNSNEKLLRWLELGIFFAVSLLILSIIQGIFPESLNYENTIETWLTKYIVVFCILAVIALLYAAAYYWFCKKEKSVENIRWIQKSVAVVLMIAVFAVGVCTVYYNFFNSADETSRMAAAFTLNDEWGNGRGATWRAGAEAFATMPVLNKIVGIGPDCFYLYAYNNWDISVRLYNIFGDARLTNAHNEWLTILVNMGILGFLSYAAIFLTAIFRQTKEGRKREILLISAVCIISYTVHNMVSFQQVICTPIIFILLGFGEKMLRNSE